MIFMFLLLLFFAINFLPIFYKKGSKFFVLTAEIFLCLLIALSVIKFFYQNIPLEYSWTLIAYNSVDLVLSVRLDELAHVVIVYILVIGFFIYHYSRNYLDSDSARMRFLSQINIVILCVVLLVISANLLTAFVAWQLIGINIYLLLNHYHDDPLANRAAKKKFVINRIGDCSFLLAVVLSFYSNSAGSFSMITTSPDAKMICGLIFISVMTKCAQFPFHIWLIDTMEAPTPVSALMHAGVINAGGFLLARIGAALTEFSAINYFILFVGLFSAILSVFWMNQQPDTKKKLAYSTMGQMGYMLAQCSLGAFPAAVFHLITHGFYKASLFLNAGETLQSAPVLEKNKVTLKLIIKSLIITLLMLYINFIFQKESYDVPIMIYGFIAFTIFTTILHVEMLKKISVFSRVLNYIFLFSVVSVYYFCFHKFSHLIPDYAFESNISFVVQASVLIAFFTVQMTLWMGAFNVRVVSFSDSTERFLRIFLLNPLRSLGDIVNDPGRRSILKISYLFAFILVLCAFLYGTIQYFYPFNFFVDPKGDAFVLVFLLIGIAALVIANRCFTINRLIIYIVLFQFSFVGISFFDGGDQISKIGIFHIINIALVIIMMKLLSKVDSQHLTESSQSNEFSSRVFYLVFGLLLLIGIPGTASFISEFYLLHVLVGGSGLLVFLYFILIVLLSIVVMHSLQLYAFNKNYSNLMSSPLRWYEHAIFLSIISFNIFSGLFPNSILNSF
ncbi:MAG: proton-conducting transporter membrane subunit [Gammaproteobacteria bacterium]